MPAVETLSALVVLCVKLGLVSRDLLDIVDRLNKRTGIDRFLGARYVRKLPRIVAVGRMVSMIWV